MNAQARIDGGGAARQKHGTEAIEIAPRPVVVNAVHLMQSEVRDRLNRQPAARRGARRLPLHALVTVPTVAIGAACLLPMAIVTFGVSRLVRGRVEGVAGDTADAARAMWRATGAVIGALTNRGASGS